MSPRRHHGVNDLPTLVAGALASLAFLPTCTPATESAEPRYAIIDMAMAFGAPLANPEGENLRHWQPGIPTWTLSLESGEAYPMLGSPRDRSADQSDPSRIVVSIPTDARPRLFAATETSGTLSYHSAEWNEAAVIKGGNARLEFLLAKSYQNGMRWRQGIPGSPLFHREYTDTLKQIPEAERNRVEQALGRFATRPEWQETDELERTYGLFTGDRALVENLQLDRLVQADDLETSPTKLSELAGISTQALDWKPYLPKTPPRTDYLAGFVPADNLSAFLPSFASLTAVLDEVDRVGNPLAGMAADRSEDQQVRFRVEEQLCLPSTWLSRTLGPSLVSEVAVTCGDPYWAEGTDIAILFRTRNATALAATLAARRAQALQTHPQAKVTEGTVAGTRYVGVASPGRTVCSLSATVDDVVIVTNSQVLLERLLGTHAGTTPALSKADEYTFFRSRYQCGDTGEDVLLVLTDAAIRKWCDAKWRITEGRRRRVLSAMMEESCTQASRIVAGMKADEELPATCLVAPRGHYLFGPEGVRHPVYGSTGFLTPISELKIEVVSDAEARAYRAFQARYQSYWRQYFDPICIRLGVKGSLRADVTVMPLITGTDYADLREFSQGTELAPRAGDLHPDAVFHLIWHLNPDSRFVRELEAFVTPGMSTTAGTIKNPLGWLGDTLEVYADQSPFWDDIAKAPDPWKQVERSASLPPVAARFAVRNSLGLAAFLTSLKAMAEAVAPGLSHWAPTHYRDRDYVRIAAEIRPGDRPAERDAITYYPEPKSWTIALGDAPTRHAIDRLLVPVNDKDLPSTTTLPPADWLGGHAAAAMHRSFLAALLNEAGEANCRTRQRQALSNLPILDEWKRRFPDKDPVEVQKRVLGTALVAPGGRGYQWVPAAHAMESVAFGSAGVPRKAEDAWPVLPGYDVLRGGVTFEKDGLRARFAAERLR